ncbi:LysR family transcriptional regulator [Roseovarius indicus]|uniref:HTH-type transcriptional regulator GltC n=1 Tax=Roseovarius indicus TaxID=540747 RepID=A0A0T5P7R9_9RHOB|nr:LysR family transcriptional regulator [Roseovarius indicus]KRS17243.1 LysR family transcriptional regulator [Roseovarius indicus]QEW27632.1 HTH-type transcriptional regulator GltC [Roseovarius indicus]SFE34272.1 transcriptional regulator, LysR family [Roseovarius indicus]
MRNLDMTTLRSFVAVAEQGGVTRAASALNLTQSAVSMQLKRLEELLGQELLDRSNRRIALTGSGELLLTYARRLVDLNDEAVGRLTDEVYEGEIVLGAPYDIVYPVVPQVLKRFNSIYPRVKVHLKSSSTLKLLDAKRRGEADLILTTEEEPGPGGETLTEMPLRWVGAPGGLSWKRKPLKLAFCNVCIFRAGVLRRVDAQGIEWEMVIDSDDDRSVEALISADLAVGALLEDSIPPHLEAIQTGGALPDLGVQRINMYGADSRKDVLGELADMLRQGFAATRGPVAVTA